MLKACMMAFCRLHVKILRSFGGKPSVLKSFVNDTAHFIACRCWRTSPDFQAVDINKLLSDIKTNYLVQLNQSASHWICSLTLICCKLISTRYVSHRFDEYLDNALRYTPEDGRVVIAIQTTKNEMQINIHDSGEGVTPEEASHLFDRFLSRRRIAHT